MSDVLDHAVWAALTGPHAHFAESHGQAVRYPEELCPFAALEPSADPRGTKRAWADLADLVGPGGEVVLAAGSLVPPEHWEVRHRVEGVQLVDVALQAHPDPEARPLGPEDVAEMLALVERTQPGPFRTRTVELGTYLGIRREGALVAMAGERLHPAGWTEISAVCTEISHRGQGLATRLVRAVAAGIRQRGETPFMHASAGNTRAIALYTSLGFALRTRTSFFGLRAPGALS